MFRQKEIFINNSFTRLVGPHITDLSFKDKTHYEPITVEASIETKKLFNDSFYSNFGFQTEILPPNCRFFKNLENGKKLLILEDEPKLRTVSFDLEPEVLLETLKINGKYKLYGLDKFKRVRPFKLTLSFPYIVYFLSLSKENDYLKMSVFFRLNPISSLDDYLLKPCISNINESGGVCLGYERSEKSVSLTDSCRDVIDNFWFNNFNKDYTTNCKDYEEVPELCDYFTWSYNSKVDPLFIFSINWLSFKKIKCIKDVVSIYCENNNSNSDIVSSLGRLIERTLVSKNKTGFVYEERDFTQEIYIESPDKKESNNMILSIGDEVLYEDKKCYITALLTNDYDFRKLILEDENNEKIEVNISNKKAISELSKNFKINNPTSVMIKDTKISINDLVLIKESGNIQMVEKIIRTRDNRFQIKLGRFYYLDSCFLDENLEKLENFEFCGVKLIPGNKYYLLHLMDASDFLLPIQVGIFKNYYPVDSVLWLAFVDSEGKDFSVSSQSYYLICNEENLMTPPVFRVDDCLFTNSKKPESATYLIKNQGIGYKNSMDSDNYLKLSKVILREYFEVICNSKVTSIKIESFDQDLVYSIGDEIIHIDWTKPNEMFDIKTIVGFEIDDKFFNLLLQNQDNMVNKIPFINLSSGRGDFGKVRHVAREINDLKIGMRVKAKSRKFCDFPMKDCNEIKAFVIDDAVEPLVLFSNYRTLLISDLIESGEFDIFIPGSKSYEKTKLAPVSEKKIKIQDGDLFYSQNNKGSVVIFVHSSGVQRMKFLELKSGSRYRHYTIDYNSRYQSSMVENKNRYGLLLPRFKDEELRQLKNNSGYPTIFSSIFKYPKRSETRYGFGIRRNWKDGTFPPKKKEEINSGEDVMADEAEPVEFDVRSIPIDVVDVEVDIPETIEVREIND